MADTLRDLYNHHKEHSEVLFRLSYLDEDGCVAYIDISIEGGPKKGMWLVWYRGQSQAYECLADWDNFPGGKDPADWGEAIALACLVFSAEHEITVQPNTLEKDFEINIRHNVEPITAPGVN